eukprot:TRINITY_DN59324_c0_g1_i1.p1 TRINITY_DN59324_c0_g1~~TRINITY_DN59324_c0_g1_i1.p1  ORF type:complete len:809 (-),score=82.23 TRINITY_DN59324_c0_g1_i1:123-2549(-)
MADDGAPDLFPGEFLCMNLMCDGDVALVFPNNDIRSIGLQITDYRLRFLLAAPLAHMSPISIPLMWIETLERSKEGPKGVECMFIQTKGVFNFTVMFKKAEHFNKLYNMITALIPRILSAAFAFNFKGPNKDSAAKKQEMDDGWALFNVEAELERQLSGLLQYHPELEGRTLFRLEELNDTSDGEKSKGVLVSYPLKVIVPEVIPREILINAGAYRSRGRIPAVSWIHPRTGALIARGSQPMPGLRWQRSHADEKLCTSFVFQNYTTAPAANRVPAGPSNPPPLVEGVKKTAPPAAPPSLSMAPPPLAGPSSSSIKPASPPTAKKSLNSYPGTRPGALQFVDARRQVVATANMSMGGGYEDTKNYSGARLSFLCMENIHVVNDAFQKLRKVISSYNNLSTAQPGAKGGNSGFMAKLDASDWLLHIQRIVWGAVRLMECLENGDSVVTHCTDGWDRTSQVVAMTMLLLDPYFRTCEGFMRLITKEWIQFGHRFNLRHGVSVTGEPEKADWDEAEVADKKASVSELDEPVSGSSHSPNKKEKEPKGSLDQRSPIFLQWCDAIFQVVRQFPTAFEFTPHMIEYILDASYSCKYGTFLCNNEVERLRFDLKNKTWSLWTDLKLLVQAERDSGSPVSGGKPLVNGAYKPTSVPLRPSHNSKHIVLWESYYLRYDLESAHIAPSDFYGNRHMHEMLRKLQAQVAMYRQQLGIDSNEPSSPTSSSTSPPSPTQQQTASTTTTTEKPKEENEKETTQQEERKKESEEKTEPPQQPNNTNKDEQQQEGKKEEAKDEAKPEPAQQSPEEPAVDGGEHM